MADSAEAAGTPSTDAGTPAPRPSQPAAPRVRWTSRLLEPQMFVGLAALLVSVSVFAAVLDKPPAAYAISTASERVLPAGGQIRLLHLPREALPADFMTRLTRIGARICYGSAFDEHWQLDIPRLTGRSKTSDVTQCPAAAGDALPF